MQYLSNIQHNQNQSEQIVIHNLAAAPTSPIEGQMYQDVTTNIMYYYNGTLWVAIRDKVTFQLSVARNGTVNSSQDLRRQDGTPTSDIPYIIPFDCMLMSLTANTVRTGSNESWTAEILKNNVSEATLVIVNTIKFYANGYSNVFLAGDEIRMRALIGSSGNLTKPGITAWFREI